MAKTKRNTISDIRWEIYGLLFICFGVLGIFSIYTNAVGAVGSFFSRILKGLSGRASVLFPILLIIWGVFYFFKKKRPSNNFKIAGFIIILLVIVFLFHFKFHQSIIEGKFMDRLKHSADSGIKGVGGGFLGEIVVSILFGIFGTTGSFILVGTLFIIGFILSTGVSISTSMKKIVSKYKDNRLKPITKPKKIKVMNSNVSNMPIENTDEKPQIAVPEITQDKPLKQVQSKTNEPEDVGPIVVNSNETSMDYQLPPVSLLKKNNLKQNNFSEKELLNNAQILEKTLESFGVQAKVVQVSCGPTITRFEIQPSPGVKVSKIVNLADDIALSLAASDVRIEAPIPGKAAVGIEVPNKVNSPVFLRDVLESSEVKSSSSKLTIGLGKDIGGKCVSADLSQMPHLLIAGATGSGKSVCINTIIASILIRAYPHEVKLMMVDPKVVELGVYDGIPHLLTPVVTDPKKASSALNWMVSEMEERYKAFAQEGVRDVNRYNELNPDNPLPKIVVIIDELADLMMVSPREVEDSICRLAQMARAAGIHLLVATQRPSVDIITGLIKANIPSRISFAVSSQVDSRTILDVSGAEKLLGKGDMLFYPVGASKPIRIQGAYISEEEVERLVEHVKKQMEPSYEKTLSDFKEMELNNKQEETDELFDEAVNIILDSGQASISMLQRRLRIGYARAARLIDQMEQRGIVGGHEGTKPREILITREQFEGYQSGDECR